MRRVPAGLCEIHTSSRTGTSQSQAQRNRQPQWLEMSNDQISSDTSVSLQAQVTDSQAQKLHEHLMRASLGIAYQEEQHGSNLVVHIRCSPSHEVSIRKLL